MTTILVPTDFSKNATAALRYAIRLSKNIKADLIVFHCSHISTYALSAAASEEQMTQLLKEDEEYKMEKLLEQVNKAYKYLEISKIPATTRCVVSYNPMLVEKTLEIANENKVGLIIMGTHGATGITKFFFGSNTSIMISKSTIPVLAIPENYRFSALQNIVFASDLEKLSNELNQLLPFAQASKSKINVLYLDYGIDIDQTKIKNAEAVIKKMAYKKIKLVCQKANIETSLVTQVKQYIRSHKPQCLVMFSRERTLWDRLFLKGSKTEDMSTALSIPLLSFKKSTTK
jgi:nucleotide-binding universal stress UspA family protein